MIGFGFCTACLFFPSLSLPLARTQPTSPSPPSSPPDPTRYSSPVPAVREPREDEADQGHRECEREDHGEDVPPGPLVRLAIPVVRVQIGPIDEFLLRRRALLRRRVARLLEPVPFRAFPPSARASRSWKPATMQGGRACRRWAWSDPRAACGRPHSRRRRHRRFASTRATHAPLRE